MTMKNKYCHAVDRLSGEHYIFASKDARHKLASLQHVRAVFWCKQDAIDSVITHINYQLKRLKENKKKIQIVR